LNATTHAPFGEEVERNVEQAYGFFAGERHGFLNLVGPIRPHPSGLTAHFRKIFRAHPERGGETFVIECLADRIALIVMTAIGEGEQLRLQVGEPPSLVGRNTWPDSNLADATAMRVTLSLSGFTLMIPGTRLTSSCTSEMPAPASSTKTRDAFQAIARCMT
jgi:hypothetical protein